MRINEKGRSMIEMLGVLAIIGVLSVGGIAGYSKAMAKYRANKTIDLVSHTVANVRILFSGQRDYKDLNKTDAAGTSLIGNEAAMPANTKTLIKNAKIFPDESVGTTGEGQNTSVRFENVYAGEIGLFAADRIDVGDYKAFMIVLSGLPQSACIDLATQDWNASSGSGFIALQAKGEGADNAASTAVKYDETFAQATISTCTTTPGNGVSVACSKDNEPMTTIAATMACTDPNFNTLYIKFY